jgi:predicted dinucleotide-binding enzyme
MRIGVLGTGTVGLTLGGKLVELGHEVRIGSRERSKDVAVEWVQSAGAGASEGTFADAAEFGELVINATAGGASLDALEAAGAQNLAGKVLMDVANPLDFEGGTPPTLSVCNRRQPGRAHPGRASRGQGREGAQHRQCTGDGRPGCAR